MNEIFEFMKDLVNPESIIKYGGIFLLLFVVFAETGLFFGFFLPGDSLMFTAGLLCATGIIKINIVLLILYIIIAAVTGNMTGYFFGKKVGILLFQRKSGFFFKQKHLERASDFYAKYGGTALILSRFLPIVRTFAPIVAGIVKLNYIRFFIYNLTGGILWVGILVSCGYSMGRYIPGSEKYLGYIVIFLIAITSIPFVVTSIKKIAKKKTER